jgi:hypothetical protein
MFICAVIINEKIMTSTIIIPSESMVYVPVPSSYIGRQVEVTFSLLDDVDKPKPTMKLSDMFKGVFSKEDAESFVEHTKTMRNEWTSI